MQYYHLKYFTGHKLRDFLKYLNRILQRCQGGERQGKTKNCHRLNETKETTQLTSIVTWARKRTFTAKPVRFQQDLHLGEGSSTGVSVLV